MAAPFDFEAAARFRKEREEAMKAATNQSPPVPASGGSAGYKSFNMSPALPNNYDFAPERRLFSAIENAILSSGAVMVGCPRVEAGDQSYTNIIRFRCGPDLMEVLISSMGSRVLVRSAMKRGFFNQHPPVPVDQAQVTPVQGLAFSLGLSLENYVHQEKSGELVVVNEGQLLSHLNEFILQKYGYQAVSMEPPSPRPSAARRLALPALTAVAMMAVVVLVVMRVRHKARR